MTLEQAATRLRALANGASMDAVYPDWKPVSVGALYGLRDDLKLVSDAILTREDT